MDSLLLRAGNSVHDGDDLPWRRESLLARAAPACYHDGVDVKHAGSAVILGGLAIALVGVALRFGLLSWFGRLPGDIRYESDNTRVYIPFVSMLLVSVVLSLLAWLWRRAS